MITKLLYHSLGSFLLAAVLFFSQPLYALELSLGKLTHNGLERSYYFHLPTSSKTVQKHPLMLVLHGGGKADGDETAKHTGYNELADQYGFIVVYPNGINSQWNDGRGTTYRNSDNTNIDDVGFITTLIDKIILDYKADASRVYVTGISNGGMMTLRLGCEISPKLAAIAPIIANMPLNIIDSCHPTSPLPLLLMNGTKDPVVPWKGGDVRFFRKKMGKVSSTLETIDFWVKHNYCKPTPQITEIPDTDRKDKSHIKVTSYANPVTKSEVILYEVEGGGHTFPGSNSPNLPRILGRKNNDIDGPSVVWKFFNSHAK